LEAGAGLCAQKAKCHQISPRNHLINTIYDFEPGLFEIAENALVEESRKQTNKNTKTVFWTFVLGEGVG